MPRFMRRAEGTNARFLIPGKETLTMAHVILHAAPGEDELVEIELPADVAIGHTFMHADAEWHLIGEVDASQTALAVRGTGAWVAAPRPVG
jgi:hypothetical protein